MSKKISDRKLVCIHEASHAVIHSLNGGKVKSIKIASEAIDVGLNERYSGICCR